MNLKWWDLKWTYSDPIGLNTLWQDGKKDRQMSKVQEEREQKKEKIRNKWTYFTLSLKWIFFLPYMRINVQKMVRLLTDKHAEKICTVDIHVLHVLIYFKEFLFIISR